MHREIQDYIIAHVSCAGNIPADECKELLRMINESENPELALSYMIHSVYYKGLCD